MKRITYIIEPDTKDRYRVCGILQDEELKDEYGDIILFYGTREECIDFIRLKEKHEE